MELDKANEGKLDALIKSENIAADLDAEQLSTIGVEVCEQYETDDNSPARAEKKKKWVEGQKLAQQVIEQKDTPFKKASNVKYPLLTTAAIQFNARAYPEIIQGNNVVKPKIVGEIMPEKIDKANMVAEFINWQLFNEMEEWEEDTDRLFLMVPLYGCMFRKTWFSKEKNRICSAIYSPEDLVVPQGTQNLRSASRISTTFQLQPREIAEKINSGHFVELDAVLDDEDTEEPEDFIEQFKWLDLDEDGFKEPYIVVVHVASEKVVRLSANFNHDDVKVNGDKVYKINQRKYFTKYPFIPATDGNFYDLGFFDLLYPINAAINTTFNQLLDAGTLANQNTGFIGKELTLRKKGRMKAEIGEYTAVNASGDDIRRAIVSLDFPGANPTLFSLLGFMVDAGREIANIKEVLQGQIDTNMQPTTVHALIEQGMKVFSGIYKRIHRALKGELSIIREWNYASKNPLSGVVLDVPFDPEYFNDDDLDCIPVSDPATVSEMQKAAKAQIYAQFFSDPYHDQMKLRSEYYRMQGLKFETVATGQDPTVKEMQGQIQQLQQAYQELGEKYKKDMGDKSFEQQMEWLKEKRADIESKADVKNTVAGALERIARAEAAEEGSQMEIYKTILEALDGEGGVPSVAGAGADTEGGGAS